MIVIARSNCRSYGAQSGVHSRRCFNLPLCCTALIGLHAAHLHLHWHGVGSLLCNTSATPGWPLTARRSMPRSRGKPADSGDGASMTTAERAAGLHTPGHTRLGRTTRPGHRSSGAGAPAAPKVATEQRSARPGGSRKRCRVQFEFFQDLPDGVQQRVLTFLPASELAGSRRVCRGWRQLFSPVFNAMCMERIGNIPYTELRKQFRLLRCLQNPTVEVGSSGLLEVTRTGARLLAWACQDPGAYPSRGGGWCDGVQLRVTNLPCCVCV